MNGLIQIDLGPPPGCYGFAWPEYAFKVFGGFCSPWFGPERPKWLGPLPHEYAKWLPEEAAGNYGFDVARFSQPEGKFDRYFELELLHARWAMLGALGAVLPGDLLNWMRHSHLKALQTIVIYVQHARNTLN